MILSTRDPKTWYTSVYNSVWQFQLMVENSWTKRLVYNTLIDPRRDGGTSFLDTVFSKECKGCEAGSFKNAIKGGPEVAEKFFREWEEDVKRNVPKDRLLVHSAKEGWVPLCKFLDVPVPLTPYPKVNDTATIRRVLWWFRLLNVFVWFGIPAAILLGLFVIIYTQL